MSRFHQLAVAGVRQETRDTVSIAFDVPEALRYVFMGFRPGQHLAVRARIGGEQVMRTYSICSIPADGELRVAVKSQPHGLFSNYANSRLKPGDVIEVMPPAGSFSASFDPANRSHYLAFAAGSGITPIISLIRAALATEPESRVTLVYGNRSTQSMIFREQLSDLKNSYMERFNLIPIMTREQTDIDLLQGRITKKKCDDLFSRWIDLERIDNVFICGPEPMVGEISVALRERGVEKERIHFELFTVPGEATRLREQRRQDASLDRTATQVSVRIDGRQLDFKLPRNTESILDAGLAAGAELPFSCKGGVCSTCRAKVVEGEVEMDVNYALEDYEIAAGYVLTCQSRPISDRVIVDYDE